MLPIYPFARLDSILQSVHQSIKKHSRPFLNVVMS
ncbi:hypothetical protein X975_20736, partial [Stegodyphus mimosarum]